MAAYSEHDQRQLDRETGRELDRRAAAQDKCSYCGRKAADGIGILRCPLIKCPMKDR